MRRECLDKDTKMVDAGDAAGRGWGEDVQREERAERRCIECPGS